MPPREKRKLSSLSSASGLDHDHSVAIKLTEETWARHLACFDQARSLLRSKADEISKRRTALEARKDALAEKNGGTEVKGADKLKLNVGGTRVSVRRETLTQFSGSRLAALFSGRWENKLMRDKNGRIFLDVNPECFKKIVDYQVLMKIANPEDPPKLPEVPEEDQEIFERLCNFFGLVNFFEQESHEPGLETCAGGAEEDGDTEQETQKVWESYPLKDGFTPEVAQALQAERESLHTAEKLLMDMEESHEMEETFVNFFASGKTRDILDLDVCGEKMTVKRSTLMQVKDSALAKQFDQVWEAERHQGAAADSDSDDDGILIEQSAYCFGKIVDLLRLRAINMDGSSQPPPPMIVAHQRDNFARVVAYYFPGKESLFIHPFGSRIMSVEQCNQVIAWLPEGKELKGLLYRASRDGWTSQDFHRTCDHKGATVTVIKSTRNFTFGGYAGASWSSNPGYTNSSSTFLFSLRCFDGLPAVKMPNRDPSHSLYNNSSRCASFGSGPSLLLGNNSHTSSSSREDINTNGFQRPPNASSVFFLTGDSSFRCAEVEVFRVE